MKAAINTLTDAYCIELAPFDVKVISVISGGVKSHFGVNLEVLHLPKGSLYEPGSKEIEQAVTGNEKEAHAMTLKVYAADVVENALRGSPKKHLWTDSQV